MGRQIAISDVDEAKQSPMVGGESECCTEEVSANAHKATGPFSKRVRGVAQSGYMSRHVSHGTPFRYWMEPNGTSPAHTAYICE
jgi:hypothetical protein